jgi:hypothetical protein
MNYLFTADKTTSPRLQARIAGLLYLIVALTAGFAMFTRSDIIVYGNAPATATNLLAHEMQFRLAFAAELIACVVNIPLAIIFFNLCSIVNRNVALAVLFLIIGGSIVQAVVLLNQFAPLVLLEGAHYLSVFKTAQLQAQAYMYLEMQNVGLAAAMVFFGCYCTLTGYLIFRSTFLPRILGVWLSLEGLNYLADSFAVFLKPALAPFFFHILMFVGIIELVFCLWLLIMGVNTKRWHEQANTAANLA